MMTTIASRPTFASVVSSRMTRFRPLVGECPAPRILPLLPSQTPNQTPLDYGHLAFIDVSQMAPAPPLPTGNSAMRDVQQEPVDDFESFERFIRFFTGFFK